MLFLERYNINVTAAIFKPLGYYLHSSAASFNFNRLCYCQKHL